MARITGRCVSALLVCLALTVAQSRGANESNKSDAPVSLRIRFGFKDKDATDWSGKLTADHGKVESIRGWRWGAGDHADGDTFVVGTRRPAAQNAAERARVQAGNKLPMQDNGIITILSGVTNDSTITFDAKPGKVDFKLSDVPYGKTLTELDGNVTIERVPVANEIAGTTSDEDYPATAVAKDGTVYVAYVSFKHGKDFEGNRERPATPESGPNSGPLAVGEVKKIEKPEDLDYLAEPAGGDQIYLQVGKSDGSWGEPIPVTDGKNELYRPAVAVDGSGKVWVIYSAHLNADEHLDYGNWELMARPFDAAGKASGDAVNISNADGADFMPAATTDSSGVVWVTWVGGREKNFNVFFSQQTKDGFDKPKRASDAKANEWEPAIAADSKGNVAVAWDTYAKGDYDVYVSRRSSSGEFEKPQAVAATIAFEVRPSLAYDADGKLWIAWEESGDQWGKDFGGLKKKGIAIYQAGRSLGVRAIDSDGKWFAPPDVMDAMPRPANTPRQNPNRPKGRQPAGVVGAVAPSYPRLATDPSGGVWLSFRGKPGGNWRVPVGSVWHEYVTKLGSEGWSDAVWLPRSANVLDNRPAVFAREDRLTLVYSGDGRGEANPAKVGDPHMSGTSEGEDSLDYVAMDGDAPEPDAIAMAKPEAGVGGGAESEGGELVKPDDTAGRGRANRGGRRAAGIGNINCDLFTATVMASQFASGAGSGKPALSTTQPAKAAEPLPDVAEERDAIKAMHDYRINLNGEALRIWRGEFHRHTEFSPDGGGDGGLLDMWRYAIDAADLDWIGDGDHDYGSGREYSWWTTQKAVTLFTLTNTFTPMYCYERSVSYPEGHRNCMFAVRGIRSLPRLPITDPEKFAPAPDTNMLYMYLKHFNGVCAPHTSATDMGTDWRNYDAEVEPFVEIFQGDRNNYERPDAPRSAVTEAKLKQSTPEKESMGGWRPKGFVNLALKMGYKFAFECSSDHISTHLSYCNVFVTEPTREKILEAVKKKRVYASTDNIIADVRCKTGDGERFMGESFKTSEAPTLKIHIVGAQKIAKVTIIKDDEEVKVWEPGQKDVTLSWTDPKPTNGKESYYYVRGEQVPDMEGVSSGELVWASPMWITYEGK